MNKRIFLTLVIVLTFALSLGTIYASDINADDSYALDSQDNEPVAYSDDASDLQVTDFADGSDSSNDVLKSEDLNTLSTNMDDNNNTLSSADLSKTVTAKDVAKYYKGSAKYTVKFLNKDGKALANTNVKIKLNNVVYTKKTNSMGVVSLNINLKPGTYKIVATNPNTGYSLTNHVKILSTIVSTDISKVYADGRKFSATFLKSNGKALANKYVKFKINGKTYKVKTNGRGKATLPLNTLPKGTFKIISYNVDGSIKINKVKVVKSAKTSLKSNDYIFLTSDNKIVKVKLLDQFGYAVPKGKVVSFNIVGKKYVGKTNNNGVVRFKLPSLKAGVYKANIRFSKSGYYRGSSVKHMVTIIPTKNPTFTVKSTTKFYQGAETSFQLALTSGNVPLANNKITLTVNGQSYTKTTNSKGIVSLPINLKAGNYTIKYSNKASSKVNAKSGSALISVDKRQSISIKNVVEGAKTIKSYYEDYNVLPSSVTAGGVEFTMPEFLYVMSESIVGLGSSKTGDVAIIYGVKAPLLPNGEKIDSKLYKKDYMAVANNTVTFIKNNKQAPNYSNSAVGKIIYNELVHGFSGILASYGNNNSRLPNYWVFTYNPVGSSSQTGTGLNEKNTVKDTSIYLKSTSNCQVGNSKIKSKVNSLTSGLSTELAKAKAIYNYVRDSISYAFYYDTNYGAVGTYNHGSGNCVDQSHLLVAMFRTAGFPARYVHGTCTFTDGTEGYVWVQVLIEGNWHVADPTSSRNSFGNIVNWNTQSYTFHGNYASLPF